MNKLPRTLELIAVDDTVRLRYIDQRKLPQELVMVETTSWEQVVDAIKTLAVRGAPAIGVAGVAAFALWAAENRNRLLSVEYENEFDAVAATIASARPTAVNLQWGIERALKVAGKVMVQSNDAAAIAGTLFALCKQMESEDEATNRAIGQNGAELLKADSRILTHCNAGSLATVFYGTALGVVYAAAEQGKIARVYADETRPLGQGARLTAWELAQAGIPVTLICDDMAASVMTSEHIDAVIVGADRIAANGDTANKIGTYAVAICAAYHSIPLYVAAPFSTIDPTTASGVAIQIEQRSVSEVLPEPIAGVDVLNPAFDVTPASLITAFITERGVIAPKDLESYL